MYIVSINLSIENEAGATVTAAEENLKRLNNDYFMALARREEAARALQFLRTPRVDYSKTMNDFYTAEDSKGRLKCLLGSPKVDYYSKTKSEARPYP